MSDTASNILSALEALDLLLSAENKRFEIIVCGGFIIDRRYGLRASDDLDVLSPVYNEYLSKAAKEVKNRWPEINVNLGWLNWSAAENLGVNKGLRSGWEARAMAAGPLFEGSKGGLVVYGLAKNDLVATKLASLVSDERDKDLIDLANLGVTIKDIELLTDDVINLMKCRSDAIAEKLANPKILELFKRSLRYLGENDIKNKANELKNKEGK